MINEAAGLHRAGNRQAPFRVIYETLRGNMKGSVSEEKDAVEVLHEVSLLKDRGMAVTLIAHHGRGHDETKGCTEWEDAADAVRHYGGTVKDGNTKITFYKVKRGKSGRVMAVTYELKQLDGYTAMVAADGKYTDNTSDLFKDGAKPQDKPATETSRTRDKHDPSATTMTP